MNGTLFFKTEFLLCLSLFSAPSTVIVPLTTIYDHCNNINLIVALVF